MGSAAFLMVINISIGLGFATAFMALGRRAHNRRRAIALAPWCAAGFVAAAVTAAAEALSAVIPSVRLTSTLSFSSLMLAITLITSGLMRQYRPDAPIGPLFALAAFASAINTFALVDLPRGTWGHSLGYQGPFALMLTIAGFAVLFSEKRQPVDLALGAILMLSAAQFLFKAWVATWTAPWAATWAATWVTASAGRAPGVRDYATSAYAFYSQTAGAILSLLLGIALVSKVAVEALAEASRYARLDTLSGALTRGAFLEEASRLIGRAAPGATLAVVMADLDHFKSINDRFGHAAGDRVIEVFGNALVTIAGSEGLCGRIGGEEFCVLLSGCDHESVGRRIEEIRKLVAASDAPMLPAGILATASFGIALTNRDESLEASMHRADGALYAAKAAGRNTWRTAPPAAGMEAVDRR